MRPQKPYIDDYYFCVVKMEKGYAIAVSFAFLVYPIAVFLTTRTPKRYEHYRVFHNPHLKKTALLGTRQTNRNFARSAAKIHKE
jgi:hypothetical protein